MLDKTGDTNYWKIAVEAPLRNLLTYSSVDHLQPGQSVDVSIGKRRSHGVVIEKDLEPSEAYIIKPVSALVEDRPQLEPHHLRWAQWLADYYHYPIGEVLAMFFPPLKRQGRKKTDLFEENLQHKNIQLNPEQQKIFNALKNEQRFSSHLIWGVTGSGKTEVYIELIQQKIAAGQSSIVLLPEISLTPQLVSRFRSRLGDQIAVIHSHLTERQKTDQWWAAVSGEKKVLIGARSALFCPVPQLGLIVIDEEHEASFKQDEQLRYHARDAAIVRAKMEDCPIILGTATPSLETWKNIKDEKFSLHSLNQRAASGDIPLIETINLQEEKDQPRPESLPYWLSQKLFLALEENYKNNLQSALFLNRRGVAQMALCNGCGFVYMCPNCEISLTLHGKTHLVCHYCQYTDAMGEDCPDCKVGTVKSYGLGTEQVETDLKKLFPMARVFRVDRDEIDSRQRLEEFIEKMEKHEIDFLVGTQMIAKGLDFEKLTLVGLVLADVGFNIPDFRSTERSYQLITQVSGRSGRHQKGRVLVQTYKPDHPSLAYSQDPSSMAQFLDHELLERQELDYPPFARLACIKISGLTESQVRDAAGEIKHALITYLQEKSITQVKILGPAPAPLLKIRNRYRYQILIKSADVKSLHLVTQKLFFWKKNFSRVKFTIDIDPYNMM